MESACQSSVGVEPRAGTRRLPIWGALCAFGGNGMGGRLTTSTQNISFMFMPV